MEALWLYMISTLQLKMNHLLKRDPYLRFWTQKKTSTGTARVYDRGGYYTLGTRQSRTLRTTFRWKDMSGIMVASHEPKQKRSWGCSHRTGLFYKRANGGLFTISKVWRWCAALKFWQMVLENIFFRSWNSILEISLLTTMELLLSVVHSLFSSNTWCKRWLKVLTLNLRKQENCNSVRETS